MSFLKNGAGDSLTEKKNHNYTQLSPPVKFMLPFMVGLFK